MKIVDVFNRPLRDVRISVIDQCNLRCTYCMPAEVYPSRKIIGLFIIFLLLVGTACSSKNVGSKSNKTILTVSAASSLREVLEQIDKKFQEANPDIELRFNFGTSGALKQQIEQGAPVDLYITASEDTYAELVDRDFIHIGASIVSNELVIITSKNADFDLQQINDLTNQNINKLAMGTPIVVPAGTYAQQALQYAGIWEILQEKIVFAKDVRQVLTYVETENVQAGIVYKTDAMLSDKVKIVVKADPESHDPIKYPIGILESTNHKTEALLFFNYIKSGEAEDLWRQFGFDVIK